MPECPPFWGRDDESAVTTHDPENWTTSEAPDGAVAYRRLARGLAQVGRASSGGACLNSVWRMQPVRHRSRPPGLLDLKRRYWNGRAFGAGKRQRACPEQLWAVELLPYEPWTLLLMDPEQVAQQGATPPRAA